MATQNWIPLFEYSSKYDISLSTLRRRIKTNAILFKLEGGKYFILDDEQANKITPPPTPPPAPVFAAENYVEASVFTSANRLVEELKAAYAKILQEKEEQIGILKEQILDLNMLVNLLEKQSDGKKPAGTSQGKSPELEIENFYFPEIDN